MNRPFSYLLVLILYLAACEETTVQFDRKKESAAILELHHLRRDYHFNKDSVAFANQLSDDFISVNRGVISRPTKEETLLRYDQYFSSLEFLKWDDLSEPIIRFSEDGTLAYTIVDKIVQATHENEQGEAITGTTHFAWMAIYRKYGDEWKIDCHLYGKASR